MKTAPLTVCLLASLAITACSSPALQPASFPERSILVETGVSIVIELNTGLVEVVGVPGDALRISGQLSDPGRTDYQVREASDEIRIAVEYRGAKPSSTAAPPVWIKIEAPAGASLRLETFDAGVSLRDTRGRLEVNSVAGDIQVQNVTGEAVLKSGRGDVKITDSQGDFSALSEHGVVTIVNAQGQIAATTIMGGVWFTGAPASGDLIRLEADHGSIEVQLSQASSVGITIASTYGDVSCTLPGLSLTSRGCTGALGNGEAQLWARSVSGAINLGWIAPAIPTGINKP